MAEMIRDSTLALHCSRITGYTGVNDRKRMAEAFVLNDGGVADTLVFA
jgi:hypothetical protein